MESLPDISQPQSKQNSKYLLRGPFVLVYTPIMLQVMKTWHLVCVVCGVTGVGLLLILARTVAQALTDPDLVINRENPEGTTVSIAAETMQLFCKFISWDIKYPH